MYRAVDLSSRSPLNDDCVLPGWASDLWFFSVYSYVSEDKSDKISFTYMKYLVLAANLI